MGSHFLKVALFVTWFDLFGLSSIKHHACLSLYFPFIKSCNITFDFICNFSLILNIAFEFSLCPKNQLPSISNFFMAWSNLLNNDIKGFILLWLVILTIEWVSMIVVFITWNCLMVLFLKFHYFVFWWYVN